LAPCDSGHDFLEIIHKVEFGGDALVDTLGSSMVHIPIDSEAESNAEQRIPPMDKEHHNHFDENSRKTDPSVTKWGVEMFWFLFNFINIVFLKEFFKFFIPALLFNDWISATVHTSDIF